MRKKVLTLLGICLIGALLVLPVQGASGARQLFDSMYMSTGRLPINDLVADIEVYMPLDKQEQGASLKMVAKDKIIFKKPSKLKIDSIIKDPGGALDGRELTIIRDGVQRWMYVSTGQYPVKKGPDEPSPTLRLPPNIQVYPQDADNHFSLMGTEVIKKVQTKVVKIEDTATKEVKLIWIDPVKMVPLKYEMEDVDPKGTPRKVIVLSSGSSFKLGVSAADEKSGGPLKTKVCNYREFRRLKDGRWFPFVIEIQKEGKTKTLIVYKAISVNVGIEDHIFKPMEKFVK